MADRFEFVQIQGEHITPSLLIWRRYKRPAPGVLGEFLDTNPHIAEGLMSSPFLPLLTVVRIPIHDAILNGRPMSMQQVTLSGLS